MPVEELSYTIPNDGAGDLGSEVDLFLTYQINPDDPDGPTLVTAASGTYKTLDASGNVIDSDTVVGIDAVGSFGGNDNELFINPGTSTAAYVSGNGISFQISNNADSNDGDGNVNFYSYTQGDDPTNLYGELSDNEEAATNVTEAPACFMAGTRIRTTVGEVAVEHLAVGDLLITAAGKSVPLIWVGTWQVELGGHRKPHIVHPIRIARGALGHGAPHRDLYVSPDHALYLDGMLVPAHLLCNGETITQPPAHGTVTYYHVEVAPHDILLAEGAPTESFLDLGGNNFSKPGEEPKSWEDACAPLLLAGPQLTAIQRRLRAKAKQAVLF